MGRSLYAWLSRHFNPTAAERISRREAMKQAMAATAGLLLSASHSRAQPKKPERRVIIVGAGLAGLTCASELHHAGYSVQVFEARPRISGRVFSDRTLLSGTVVEGGAEFIGLNHPTWLAYAARFHLQLREVADPDAPPHALLLGCEKRTGLRAKLIFRQLEKVYDAATEDARAIDAEEPWKSPNAEELDRRSLADFADSQRLTRLGQLAFNAECCSVNGNDPAHTSYLGELATIKAHGLESRWSDPEHYRCNGGAQQLAEKLAGTFPADRIHLSTPVAEIDTSAAPVRIQTAAGERLEADDVVLAIPPTVWEKIRFTPALPACLGPQMGNNIKYVAALTCRYYKNRAVTALSDGPLGTSWEQTDDLSGCGVAVVSALPACCAVDAIRRLSPEDRLDQFRGAFDQIAPGFQSHLLADRLYDWVGDPWTLGSYSNAAPGQVTSQGPILRAGIGRLHFAGEHTSYGFAGYMEGALRSGAAAARRLAQRDGVAKQD
jgi:monoamine oxidase